MSIRRGLSLPFFSVSLVNRGLYNFILSCFIQAQFDASEMITQREIVSQKVSEELITRASQFGIILDDISLVGS